LVPLAPTPQETRHAHCRTESEISCLLLVLKALQWGWSEGGGSLPLGLANRQR
jgi:hypothetical protein